MKRFEDLAWLASLSGAWASGDGGSLRRHLDRLGSVLAVQHALHAQTDVAGVAKALLARARDVHPSDAVVVALTRDSGVRELDMFTERDEDAGAVCRPLSVEEGTALRAEAGPRDVEIAGCDSVPGYLEPLAAAHMAAATVVPLVVQDRILGILAFGRRRGLESPDELRPFLRGLADAAALALGNARQLEESSAAANLDSLTGLPNRRVFFERLDAVLGACDRNGHAAAAFFIDLDSFKRVNDTVGSAAGDRVIRQVAQRLFCGLRQTDMVSRLPALAGAEETVVPDPHRFEDDLARLGGDEFAVILSKIADPQDASLVAKRIGSLFDRPFDLGESEVFLSASIGIAVYPGDGRNADTLLRNADTAMFCAKKRGKNCFQYYTKSMNAEASRRLHIETRMRSALERGEFDVWYQLQRDARSGQLVGAEALLRWDDPEMGMVSPAEFVPLAEQTGCIGPIGEFVLRRVCDQLRAWRERGYAPLRTAVNLSANQLRQPDFVETVATILAERDVSPAQLELEMTESAIMGEDESAVRSIEALSAMGFGLALDDFGTGYSSLSYLRRFPINGLKIDRTFVRELPDNDADRSLTSAIIAMAHGLGLRVVAEGVETEAQARFLTERGCDDLQGFLFGRPVPAEQFEDILEREKSEGRS